jgi:peroxiredoxin
LRTVVGGQGVPQMIKEGTQAPGFKLKDHLGREISLDQFKGARHVMLLFYPLDWTPT